LLVQRFGLELASPNGAKPVMAAANPDQCWPFGLESSGTRRPLNVQFLAKRFGGFN
jgi:hypothetical protein